VFNIIYSEAASIYLLIYLVTFTKYSSALERNTCYKFHTDNPSSKTLLLANIVFIFTTAVSHLYRRNEMVSLYIELN